MLRHDIVLNMDSPLGVDLRPKTIWGGLTIPGKKMMKVVLPEASGVERGKELLKFYEDDASLTLLMVAQALHHTPEQGMSGPAFRDIGERFSIDRMYALAYGAILTDIRDFLKLRFRAKSMFRSPGIRRGKAIGGIEEG